MTNEQIIKTAKINLIKSGKIQPDDEIHTYNHWKKLGYQVFRGEKAVIALNIWKAFNAVKKEDDEEQPDGVGVETRMSMKKAYFFSTNQVFKLE